MSGDGKLGSMGRTGSGKRGGRDYRLNWTRDPDGWRFGEWRIEAQGLSPRWVVFRERRRFIFGERVTTYRSADAAKRKVERFLRGEP